jgi:hypothetical protein
MNPNFNFSDRTSYLSWASAWKEEYATHSRSIIALKRDFKDAQRNSAPSKIEALRHALQKAKGHANGLIAVRHQSKIEAQRQYLANKAAA